MNKYTVVTQQQANVLEELGEDIESVTEYRWIRGASAKATPSSPLDEPYNWWIAKVCEMAGGARVFTKTQACKCYIPGTAYYERQQMFERALKEGQIKKTREGYIFLGSRKGDK